MKVFVTGTRGIPEIQGGVETHCEALYPRLTNMGINITLSRRSAYLTDVNRIKAYRGIEIIDLYSPKQKSIEAIVHTLLSILYAKLKGFKFIHIHAIGPSLAIPFARLLGLKVVMTHHGPDYDRQKWGKVAKISLKLGEWCAAKFANEIIVISNTIESNLKEKYNRCNVHLIPNGVQIQDKTTQINYIKDLGLEPQNYMIAVGRFVPEKGFHDLIDAYLQSNLPCKLVLVGDADHESEYSRTIKEKAKQNGVVLTGFIKGEKLHQIYSHAGLFVMPSYHEGLPIALLEALSYNLKTVVSNIPPNIEVGLKNEYYFETGNMKDLAEKINQQIHSNIVPDYNSFLSEKYNWDIIAQQTLGVYKKLE